MFSDFGQIKIITPTIIAKMADSVVVSIAIIIIYKFEYKKPCFNLLNKIYTLTCFQIQQDL